MEGAVTVQLSCGGRPVRVHLFSTGRVAVKTRFFETRCKGLLSTLDFIFDRCFTGWLPIWVMVVEHPEGIFVIDTGERAEVTNPGYFRSSGVLANWFDRSQFRFLVAPEEEIGPQMKKLSIAIADIRAVVLTHLHFDHTDGLCYFPDTPILVNRLEWERPFGALPRLYPPWFKPSLFDLNSSCESFAKAHYLNQDLVLVHTPGHTRGHCSILLRSDSCHILFAGDICYTPDQLARGRQAANAASRKHLKQTYAAVKAYASLHPLVVIPSHDAAAGTRLKDLEVMKNSGHPPTARK
jgi:N-acyl homoserine lactone hydrolase